MTVESIYALFVCHPLPGLSLFLVEYCRIAGVFGPLGSANMPAALTDSSQIICEVWARNVEDEMRKIRQIIQSYNYIAMVSHFERGWCCAFKSLFGFCVKCGEARGQCGHNVLSICYVCNPWVGIFLKAACTSWRSSQKHINTQQSYVA